MSNLAGALIGGAASLGGTIASYNAAMNQNAEARRQFDESMRFAKYQYADMKRYNSPENQLRLMRQAGINPALAIGQLPSSAAVGSSVPGSTATMVQPDFSGLSVAADIAAQYDTRLSQSKLNSASASAQTAAATKMATENAGLLIDNAFKPELYKSDIYHKNSLSWLADQQSDLVKTQLKFEKESLGDRLFQQRWQSELTRAQTEAQILSNSYLPERARQEISKLITDQKVALMTGKASIKSAMAAVMQAVNTQHAFDAQYGGNPNQRGSFFNATLRAFNDAHSLSTSQKWANYLNAGANVFSSATSLFKPFK